MTTPTGQIAMSDVNNELGKSSTSQITLNDSNVRDLAGISSGTIGMANLRGKAAQETAKFFIINTGGSGTYRNLRINVIDPVNGGVTIYEDNVTTGARGPTGATITVPNDHNYVYTLFISGNDPGGGHATFTVEARRTSNNELLDTDYISGSYQGSGVPDF